jgi:hypothetical protein
LKLLALISDIVGKIKKKKNKKRKLYLKGCSERLKEEDIDQGPYSSFFDGLGPVTAREIVKRRIDRCIIDECGIKELVDSDRYYIARLSEAKGSIIHTLLVDKQKGMVRSLYRKANR